MRLRYDSHSLWTLTGVALRIAQRMGLHRDGVDLKLPPFETEMRRRLWWQITFLEARASEFSAVGQISQHMDWTTKTPLNVNDSSLHPSMVELPAEQNGATEMLHCLIRYEVGNFLKSGSAKSTYDGSWQKFQSSEVSVKDKEKAIQSLEELFERKFLRYCDPSIPLHFISGLLAGSTACKLRFRAYHPRHHWARGESVLPEEKDMLFSACVTILENHNIAQSSPSTQRYLWHVNAHFQFDALIHVLGELRSRPASELTNNAWQQTDQIFQHHSNMLTDTKRGLHVAITRLAVRAWENYERYPSTGPHPLYQIQSPLFRDALSRNATSKVSQPNGVTETPKTAEQDQMEPTPTESMADALGPPFDFNALLMESTPMDWSRWDDLMEDFELDPTAPTF